MSLSRREMLCNTAAGCAAAATVSLWPGCGFDVTLAEEVPATADVNGQVKLLLSDIPALMPIGGAVILNIVAPSAVAVPEGGVLLVHQDAATFAAVAARCTHAACPLGYAAADKQIACPCHGSRFLAASTPSGGCIGDVVRGPAQSGVRAFAVTFAASTNLLTLHLLSAPSCENGTFLPSVVNGKVVLPFARLPMLSSIGGTWTGQPQGLSDKLIVIRIDEMTADALSAVCTHQGCTVNYSATNRNLRCPCHSSTYDLGGTVLVPAPGATGQRPLKKYATTLDAESITVLVT